MGVDDQKRGWVSQVHRLELEEIGFGLLEEKDKKNGDPGAAHDEMSTLRPRSFPISVLGNKTCHKLDFKYACLLWFGHVQGSVTGQSDTLFVSKYTKIHQGQKRRFPPGRVNHSYS